MLLNTLQFGAGGKCVLAFEEEQQWLRATWTGLVGNHEAMQGAKHIWARSSPWLVPTC
jgi:hypothetical protein